MTIAMPGSIIGGDPLVIIGVNLVSIYVKRSYIIILPLYNRPWRTTKLLGRDNALPKITLFLCQIEYHPGVVIALKLPGRVVGPDHTSAIRIVTYAPKARYANKNTNENKWSQQSFLVLSHGFPFGVFQK